MNGTTPGLSRSGRYPIRNITEYRNLIVLPHGTEDETSENLQPRPQVQRQRTVPCLLAGVQNVQRQSEGVALPGRSSLALRNATKETINGNQRTIRRHEARLGFITSHSYHWQNKLGNFHFSRQEGRGIRSAAQVGCAEEGEYKSRRHDRSCN